MTLQKLAAGSGYEYLTRQVAAIDSTEKGSIPLAYYAAKGESPGRWVGSGIVGVGGLELPRRRRTPAADPGSDRPPGALIRLRPSQRAQYLRSWQNASDDEPGS
jgi:hypothetical protein